MAGLGDISWMPLEIRPCFSRVSQKFLEFAIPNQLKFKSVFNVSSVNKQKSEWLKWALGTLRVTL
jgi:hypothetical protein